MFVGMKKLKDIQRDFIKQYENSYGTGEAQAIFKEILIKFSLNSLQGELLLDSQSELLRFLKEIEKDLNDFKPIQYILERAHFFGKEFYVNENVLIPRPETEELIFHLKNKFSKFDSILDIGTGSGCIALTLKSLYPKSETFAFDISSEALKVAKRNAENLELEINFIQGNILKWPDIFSDSQEFDLIVSNPPYIRELEKEEMHINVLKHEPSLALFVKNEDPLIFYNYITEFAYKHLKKSGILAFEINQYLGEETRELILNKGFKKAEIIQDINGNNRIILASF